MHDHDHDRAEGDSLRPKAARLDEPPDERRLRAALSGRLDALTPAAVTSLQRAAGNGGTGAMLARPGEEERSPVHDVVGSGGDPLPADVRGDMEARLGHDFGDVRVHTDDAAHESARLVDAHAYTVGSHIVFQRSAYDPGSTEGATTLAHELTHVVQQRSGPVEGTPAAGGISVSDPSDRFEREASATAERVMSQPAPVQREAEEPEDEETVQGAFVQREAEEELAEEPPG
ncbi:hypothetical protein BJF78_17610 [Pseudonocardia sp. CNS-139]|nr:hypothetical protein BJF78_17610 [Pseudonocardia sp. CNS-139]